MPRSGCEREHPPLPTSGRPAPDKWRQEYGGLQVNEARRLRELEQENRRTGEQENNRLKKLLADSLLDNAILQEVLGKE